MRELKVGVEEYVGLAPFERLKRWKWWFILLLIVALAIAAWALSREVRKTLTSPVAETRTSLLTTLAFLQAAPATETAVTDDSKTQTPNGRQQPPDDPTRPYIMIGILSLIAIITLVCLYVSLFSTNTGAVTTASEILKTCIGFFIGIATGYYGG